MRYARLGALVAVLALSACDKASNEGGDFPGGVGTKSVSILDPFATPTPQIPFPIDLLFAGFSDPTLNLPVPSTPSPVPALNELDGWSTTASIFTDLTGFVDFATVPAALVLVDTSTGTPLVPGTDFTVQPSTAIDSDGRPISSKRTRILIEPLKPLKPSTTYIVSLTTAARSTADEPVLPSDYFRVLRSTTPVAEQTEPALSLLTPVQKATLEQIRQQLAPAIGALVGAGVPRENQVITWAFTTQSTTLTLQRMSRNVPSNPLRLFPTGRDTSQLPLPIPPQPVAADVYVGTLVLPYYLSVPADGALAVLTNAWQADPAAPNLFKRRPDGSVLTDAGGNPVNETFLGRVPCGAFAQGANLNPDPAGTPNPARPSASTTICYPLARKRSDQTVPVIAALPKGAPPAAGWPVVIFQHGVTRNRGDMLAVAPALAQAGYAVIGIDLPLHGLLPETSPGLRTLTAAVLGPNYPGERTFDLDITNNATLAPPGGDGTDSSGQNFLRPDFLLTSRDNLRQAVLDLLALDKALAGATFTNPATGAAIPLRFDTTQVRFLGHSLGGIVGVNFLAVDGVPGVESLPPTVGAASLAMPGGGIGRLLDGSAFFGPVIGRALAGLGVNEGTDSYETYVRFAQTLVDPADSLNFAATARALHPLHMIEVVGDGVIPNCTIVGSAECPNTDRVPISGFLSGGTPLARMLGLTFRPGPGESPALSLPAAAPLLLEGAAARHNVVRIAQGQAEHGTILTPDDTSNDVADASFLAAFTEMQKEVAEFLSSNGTCLPIGSSQPIGANCVDAE